MNPKDNKNTIVIYNINCVYSRFVVSLNLMDKNSFQLTLKLHETFTVVRSSLSKYMYKASSKVFRDIEFVEKFSRMIVQNDSGKMEVQGT